MPNKCVHCGEIYSDTAEEILKGCSQCASRFFFYLSEDKLQKIQEKQETEIELSEKDKIQIENDVREIVGREEEDLPIVLDLESVRVLRPGKYLLDIANLMKRERPLVYRLEDGKYVIDIAANLKKQEEN